MGVYETGVRTAWRGLMRGAEHRIDQVEQLGAPLAQRVGAEQPPVLLLGGYGNDASAMGAFERSLQRDGFRPFSMTLPEFGFGDAVKDALAVNAEVNRIRLVTRSPTVDIVGHSRSGLVARTMQQRFAAPDSVGRVVTVASANQGLHLGVFDRIAAPALPEGMQQIRRGNEFVRQLTAGRADHDVVAVGTNGVDGVLVPASASRIDDAPFIAVDEGRVIGPFSRVGHYGILRDDTAYEAVRGALMLPRG